MRAIADAAIGALGALLVLFDLVLDPVIGNRGAWNGGRQVVVPRVVVELEGVLDAAAARGEVWCGALSSAVGESIGGEREGEEGNECGVHWRLLEG